MEPDPESGFEFWEKFGSGFGMNGMVFVKLCKSMAEMGTEPDSDSKVWRRTGSGVLVFGTGSDFGINFSNSAHL